jgi:5-methylcytosine-specific restriction endonuclease McrA
VHGSWQTPYPREFNRTLREQIRSREDHKCFLCSTPENGKKLDVHHIDYDKRNNDPFNLVALCHTCHGGLHGSLEQRKQCREKLSSLLSAKLYQTKVTT